MGNSALIARATMMAAQGRLSEAGRLLRARLKADPRDDSIRRALAELYRTAGFPDQAGRYEIAMPGSVATERDAYLRFLVATAADEERIRSLSVLSESDAIPSHILTQLEERRRSMAANTAWDRVGIIGSWCFVLSLLITLVTVYFIAIFDGAAVSYVARLGGVISLAALGVGFIGPAGSAANEGRHGAGIRWAAASIILFIASAWAAIATVVS
jgi:hypothetical protein